jgi:protein AFG1
MPFLRSTIVGLHHVVAGPVTVAYRHRVKTSALRYNAEQLSLCSKLDALYSSLLTQSKKKYPLLSSSVDRLFMIPDEHLEVAARYYSYSNRRSILSSSKMLLSTITTDNISSVAYTAAHSLLARLRQQHTANNDEQQQQQCKNNGIYIHGSVGVGKSMIMDLFYSICTHGLSISMDSSSSSSPASFGHYENKHVKNIETDHDENQYNFQPINIPTKRYHFHEFMIQIHQRIHTYKLHHPKVDPIPPIAAQIASESRLLCFDEMQIVDIADAMIMKRILTLLLELDVVIVTTSNRPPGGLYEGGINRCVFVPLIYELIRRLDVVEMMERIDYRKVKMKNEEEEERLLLKEEESRSDCGDGGGNDDVTLPSYICSSDGVNDLNDDGAQQMLTMWFSKGGIERQEMLPVAMGRTLTVNRANTSCAWFTFNELCNNPLGAADYIAIAERFDVVIVEGVPQMSGHCYNEARRFVIFIDALYEARTKLIIAANVPMDELFLGFDATVETNDGDEEIAIPDASGDSFVVGEGGSSSSSSTTMIRTRDDKTVEWSATGRVGVSLAQLSAVKEVSYSFQRAESRLAEMSLSSWGR